VDVFGGIEAGGTKFVCGVGTGTADLRTTSIPTEQPERTIVKVAEFFRSSAGQDLKAIGIGSFGPIDLDPRSETFGRITATPKQAWRNFDILGQVRQAFNLPVGFDTDVNAAALAEAEWGAARGLKDFIYLTVGTGIGGGACVNGKLIHGLMHPEMGHIRVPHDLAADPFPGSCSYHHDCLEGLASGQALRQRWGIPADQLPADHQAWSLEADYLALAMVNWVCTLSPTRIVVGGGVMQREFLFSMIRRQVTRLLNGYIPRRAVIQEIDSFIVPPELGNRAGVLGAILLAREAYRSGAG